MRENVFNLSAPSTARRVLDLFAGSGALGIEALSRGAVRAVFVERDRDAVRTIERNLDRLRLAGAQVVPGDARRGARAGGGGGAGVRSRAGRPPVRHAHRTSSRRLARYLPPLLAEDGLLVLETDARVEPELPLPLRTSRKYGPTRVTLFEGSA